MAAEGPGLLAGPALVGIQHQLEGGHPIAQQADQCQLVTHRIAGYLQLGLAGGAVEPLFPVFQQLLRRALNKGVRRGQRIALLRPFAACAVEAKLHRRQHGIRGISGGQGRQSGERFLLRLLQALLREAGQGGNFPPAVVDAHQQPLSRHLHLAVKGQWLGKRQLIAIEG